MQATHGASAGRKPWRYYYVMAFPLASSSGVTPDKACGSGIYNLQEMTEVTGAIEQREEDYLRKVAAKNAAHAADVEVERHAAEGNKKPSMASHLAWVLRRLFAASIVLLLLDMAMVYALYLRDDRHERLPQSLVRATIVTTAFVLVVNIGGWVAARRCSLNGARVVFAVGVALIIGLVLLLDEVNIVRTSHNELREALEQSEDALTQDAIDLILNGGTVPSLVQRFVFDAPSEFLYWLSVHCTSSTTTARGYVPVAIDRREFFAPLWSDSEKSCATATLRSCTQVNEVVQPILIVQLVMTSLQVIFTGVFLAVSDPLVDGKAKKRRRRLSLPKVITSRPDSATSISMVLTRLLTFGTALFGSSNAIASIDLLHFCSIADFHALFTWIMVVCLVSGISAVLAALLVGCRWKQQLASVLLVLAVASEVFMLAEFIKIAARIVGPDITVKSDQVQIQGLREVYLKASTETCSSIKKWIAHVCVGMAANESPAEFNLSCQHEFVALLLASFNFTDSYLAWSIGVKLVLLVQLILPALRQAVVNVVSYVCCLSSRDEMVFKDVVSSLQRSLPPLEYDEALELYLASMRVGEPDRVAAEREAFEKEWSIRTGRTLSNVRTPRVLVSSSDFGAIVRTLMLRRLTVVCKLDVSLSVSGDGQLLIVRIFASDNLLLATLCAAETYRLQFADAVDPGRTFWRDKREVNVDQKILDAHTIKHKLKLLLAEGAMPPKEAVWFPGESLARVSARVHALSRVSRASKGLIRCCNFAPAFVSYSPSIQRQFIYKKYPNKLDMPDTYRRSAVLRTIDCIRVTRRIIGAEFNTNAAIDNGLVSSLHCLHSTSRFDFNSRGALASSWITFWWPVHLPGECLPDDHPILNLLGRIAPFRQPLQNVRDYFGEIVAFYFAWLAFYAKMLTVPALVAIGVIASRAQHSLVAALWVFYGSPHDLHVDNAKVSEGVDKIGATISLPELVLGLAVIVWSFALAKMWERSSVWYQLQWGVFTRDTVIDSDSFRDNPDLDVPNKQSMCAELVALQRQCGSWLSVLILGGANLVVVLAMLLSQGVLTGVWGEKLAVLGSCVCQALLVQWNGACIPSVAHALSSWENPHCSSNHCAYRGSFVAKLFILQLFNTFSGLMLLLLSSVGGLTLLVQIVAPLRPLYVSYNARIEGHVGIFIQLESLLVALFAAQLSVRVFLIVSTVRRFSAIQRGDRSYSRYEYEEETMLSPYPGPNKDYAQLIMQLGLVVTFSGVCPLLPVLALIDCAVKLRQNALELCCIRQRPEPEGVQTQAGGDNDVGLGLWAPYLFMMLKLTVPIALALVFFTADNYENISVERRVGWWLIGVIGIWLVAQLGWFLVPRESRQAEEARARTAFLVERYFGHAKVHNHKAPSTEESRGKRIEMDDINLQEPAPSAEQSLHHYEERLELLQRLNVALRKREDIGRSLTRTASKNAESTTSDEYVTQTTEVPTETVGVQAAEKGEELYPTAAQDDQVRTASFVEDEALQRVSGSCDEMIVGYLRPNRGSWPSLEQRVEVEEVKDTPATEIEEPQQRRSDFPEILPDAEVNISNSGDESVIGRRAESGGDFVATGSPAPMRLSKLFKRMPPPPTMIMSDSTGDTNEEVGGDSSDEFMSPDVSFPQTELDPGVFAPLELTPRPSTSREASRNDDLLEEKQEAPPSTDEGVAFSVATPTVDSPLRRFSPRLSFLSRRPKSPASTHSDDASNRGSQIEAERTLLRQLSPRLSFLSRKSKRSSSKACDSEDSTSSLAVPEQPAPRRLSKLFKRVQPPSSAASYPSEPPPPIVTNISAFERTEIEDRAANPMSSRRDQFDFLSHAHSESSAVTSLPMQRRSSSSNTMRTPSSPPVYPRIDLSGLEAVREAASRSQFDFSADDQVWER